MHQNAALNGRSADPAIASSNAHDLGVSWMVPAGATLGSPVVAWNSTLSETLVYQGNAGGDISALDAATGSVVWSVPLGGQITSTPLVDGSAIWVTPVSTGHIYELNAATGAIDCSAPITGGVLSSPVAETPPGGVSSVYIGSMGSGSRDGLVYAISASDCATEWVWNGYTTPSQATGVWSPFSYAVDAKGKPLVLFGSANPDSSVYALDATTGDTVWTYDTDNPAGEDWDVGAGSDITAPGVNGFADGVDYVEGKNGIMYALDLTTGALIWSYDFGNGAYEDSLSTPAISGTTVLFGYTNGILAFNAVTGAELWSYDSGGDDVESSPAIVGPVGHRVVAFGTLDGDFRVLSLATGHVLYSYSTGALITASPADVGGNLIVDSDDGFVYDFALDGGKGTAPTTSVISPKTGSTIANPDDGSLTITGSATAPHGVSAVTVKVQQNGSTGPWYDQTTGSFEPGIDFGNAILASPGAKSTAWSYTIPVGSSEANYLVEASAVDTDGIADDTSGTGQASASSVSSVTVESNPDAPTVTLGAYRIAPGAHATIAATGFQADEQVTFTIPVSLTETTAFAKLTANGSGDVPAATVTIPARSAFGPQLITGTGQASGRTGSGEVFISNNSSQLGYNAQHTNYEPNDDAITDHQGAGGTSSFFNPAWSFAAAASTDSTPSVSQGVAYFGDENGDVYAVTVSTGQRLWSSTVGSAVKCTPAVDAGNIYLGDTAGNVVALDANTGASVRTTALGGTIASSPTISAGVIYVSSTNSKLYALDESTGKILWTSTLAGSSTSTPAVDGHLVIVGDSTGQITAVRAATGKPDWKYQTGSPITAPISVDSSRVYAGAANGTFYALAQATGKLDWSHTTGGAIRSVAVVGTTWVAAGSADGFLYSFDPTGTLVSRLTIGSPVTGVATTAGIYIAASAAGLLLYRGANGAMPEWDQTSASYNSDPLILNGEVFALDSQGVLNTFVIPGNPVY